MSSNAPNFEISRTKLSPCDQTNGGNVKMKNMSAGQTGAYGSIEIRNKIFIYL